MSVAIQLEWLKELWKHSNNYFEHKENLCRAILLVEVALVASLLISPIPEWFQIWLARQGSGCIKSIAVALPPLFLAMLTLFLFLAHELLLMQLRLRRGADALASALIIALTKWNFHPPKAEDLARATPQQLVEHFDGMRETSWFNKYIFPARLERPKFNNESLWGFFPNMVLENYVRLLRHSHARQFERTIAAASIILFGVGLMVLAVRIAAYFS
jgi:hypothetical protein